VYNRIIFALIAGSFTYLMSSAWDMIFYEQLSVFLFFYFLLSFIDSIGHTVKLFDITILLAIFQCLLMPAVVYHFYNDDYFVINLQYSMGVTQDQYYTFMVPAVVMLIVGFKVPLIGRKAFNKRVRYMLAASKEYLKGRGNSGVLLVIVGFVSGIMQRFVPGELNYVAYLLGKLLYVGVMYIYFSDLKNRTWFLVGGITMALLQALVSGMFGEFIFILILSTILILLGKDIKTGAKFSIAIGGAVLIMLIQTVKADYRKVIWYGGSEDEVAAGSFFSLILEKVNNPGEFFDLYAMYPTVARFNQGLIISRVMVHIPYSAPYANGETIFTSLAASFVPRVLWNDKPNSGGHYNMLRFTGYKIEGYSMNISPMGEAYGNFGINGGILFMFFYGLFFNLVIAILLSRFVMKPTLILWFPFLFLNSIQIETDVLMCVNSLIKNSIFIWFCYWATNRFLRIKL
jgi:hypothetical protein